MIKFAHLFFKGLNFGGIDSQVFLPMTTAFVPFCWVVNLAKCLISCGRRHGRPPSWPIPKDSPHPATIRWIFIINSISRISVFFGEISALAFVSVSNISLSNLSFKWALVKHQIGAAWTHNKVWRNSVAFSRHQVWNVKPSPKFLRLAFYSVHLFHIPLFLTQNSFRSTVSGFTKKQTKKVEIHRNLTALTFGSVKKDVLFDLQTWMSRLNGDVTAKRTCWRAWQRGSSTTIWESTWKTSTLTNSP